MNSKVQYLSIGREEKEEEIMAEDKPEGEETETQLNSDGNR